MSHVRTAVIPMRATGGANPTAIEALTGAITAEVRLLEDLIGVMRRQRQAVAEDDLQSVDDSVFSTHRVLVTLGEARRRRRSLSQLLGAHEAAPLRQLPELLGDDASSSLRFACDGLHAAALVLAREVEINRHVLREALADGSDYVRSLYGDGGAKLLYGAGSQPAEREPAVAGAGGRGGLLLNRKA